MDELWDRGALTIRTGPFIARGAPAGGLFSGA
jgi:hypothetical protein